MSRLARNGVVVAFEPTDTFELLVTNLAANGASNVRAEKLALGDKPGERSEPIYRIWGQPPEVARHQFVTIDEYVRTSNLARVDLIKIDVDGFDLEVLRGAKETIERFKPVVLVELNEALKTRGALPTDVLTYMLNRKYDRALVLDKENYLFTTSWELGSPWPSALQVSIDRRDPMNGNQAAIDRVLDENLAPFSPCNGARYETHADGFRFQIDAPAWSYAAAQQISTDQSGHLGIEVSGTLHSGNLGILITSADGESQISEEKTVMRPGKFSLSLPVPSDKPSLLVFRTTTGDPLSADVAPTRFVKFRQGPNEVPSLDQLSRLELASVLGVTPGKDWSDFPLANVRRVSSEALTKMLNTDPSPTACPQPHTLVDPQDLVMERDDAPVLQWLYRQLQPRTHLEFGTWEGFGTCLCLGATATTVLTVNLPSGESNEGEVAYALSREPFDPRNPRSIDSTSPSDSGEAVGWMYKAIGLQHRVTQRMQDSRTLRETEELDLSFDTALVDGSHDRDTVRSDHRLAQEWLSARGVLIWHDFTLDQQVLTSQAACAGVIAAVADDMSQLATDAGLYWIQDTLVLIRIPEENLRC